MLELRDHQKKVLDDLREAFRAGYRSIMLYGPTGMGKTELAISMLDAAEQKGSRSAMILDRITLVEQTSARLQKYNIDHGVLQSGHWRYKPDKKIQVCSAQTLEARGSFPGLQLMIVDEAHAQRKQTIEFIKNHPNIRVIGLSASPFTRGLGNHYETVVSATTTEQLVNDGWLCGLRVFIAKEIDMEGAKKTAGEWSTKEATDRGVKITGDVVAEWTKITHDVFGEPRKTIVFAAGVDHGADLSDKFAKAGYNFINISYKNDDEYKREVLEEFAKPDSSIHGLIATDILTKGFDCADVAIGISARPFSKSFSSHVQQMGRVMRQHESKEFAVWIDHSGNYLRFRDKWEDVYSNGVTELKEGAEKAAKEPTKKEKEAAKCPSCGALWVGGDACLHCGHVRPRRNEVIEVPGETLELDGIPSKKKKEKFSSEYKESFYQQLLGYAKWKGYKDGWAFHKYIEKFGVGPSWKKVAASPGPEVSAYIKHLAIKHAHRKSA